MDKKREIKYIVIHCTATQPEAKIPDIQAYWKDHLGWNNPGYHFIIKRDGEIVRLQKESAYANGVKGYNLKSIHISYIGGIDRKGKPLDNRTKAQQAAMFDKIVELTEKYPTAEVLGHRDFPDVAKACPCFDVKEWLKNYEPDFDDDSNQSDEDLDQAA
jgi:N-acetylmuramoyl-L-alanine amidase